MFRASLANTQSFRFINGSQNCTANEVVQWVGCLFNYFRISYDNQDFDK